MSLLRLIPTKGEAIVMDADEAIVGREANCNVVVPHPSVSRRHALIKRKQDVFFVVDQGSANGTFVDSKRVVDAALRDGSILRFGSASFKIEVRDDLHVESVAEDDLVMAPTMMGHPQSFSATVLDASALDHEAETQEDPPQTLQSPAFRPSPAAAPEPRPAPQRAPAVPTSSHSTAPQNRGAVFWTMIAAGALALLFVGAALGLGAAFIARRMGWL